MHERNTLKNIQVEIALTKLTLELIGVKIKHLEKNIAEEQRKITHTKGKS